MHPRQATKATTELYEIFERGIRFYVCRELGYQDLDDQVHDVFVPSCSSDPRGDLREPERLMGFVRTIARRQVASYIDLATKARTRDFTVDGRRTSLPIHASRRRNRH